jgi:hypothetical protein
VYLRVVVIRKDRSYPIFGKHWLVKVAPKQRSKCRWPARSPNADQIVGLPDSQDKRNLRKEDVPLPKINRHGKVCVQLVLFVTPQFISGKLL